MDGFSDLKPSPDARRFNSAAAARLAIVPVRQAFWIGTAQGLTSLLSGTCPVLMLSYFRGDPSSKPYKDLLQGVGTEEISHVELIGTTIARLLDGSPHYQGKKNDPIDKPGAKGATPLKIALDTGNIHHYLVAAQGALTVDAAGNPWLVSYVDNSGNLVLDLLYNLMLESTGRAVHIQRRQSQRGRETVPGCVTVQ